MSPIIPSILPVPCQVERALFTVVLIMKHDQGHRDRTSLADGAILGGLKGPIQHGLLIWNDVPMSPESEDSSVHPHSL